MTMTFLSVITAFVLFAALSLTIGLLGRFCRFCIEGVKTGKGEVTAEFIYSTAFSWALFYFLTH